MDDRNGKLYKINLLWAFYLFEIHISDAAKDERQN